MKAMVVVGGPPRRVRGSEGGKEGGMGKGRISSDR
jgi:hypothetical protein